MSTCNGVENNFLSFTPCETNNGLSSRISWRLKITPLFLSSSASMVSSTTASIFSIMLAIGIRINFLFVVLMYSL